MKVSVLVAAAMVITSVNAGRKREFKSFLKKVGGMTGSESKANLVIDDDLESGSSQDSPVHGARQRPSQIPLARRLRSILPPKSLMHNPESELAEKLVIDDDPESEPPQKSQRHEPRPGPSQSSLGHRLRSALSSKSPVYKLVCIKYMQTPSITLNLSYCQMEYPDGCCVQSIDIFITSTSKTSHQG
ncbi:hypothetical protein BASA62_006705 [Batrachochytrium salamandrivorans]|nr:hypothetical protein BASA62_006705 [Batrachochytrium salamandrivorans]